MSELFRVPPLSKAIVENRDRGWDVRSIRYGLDYIIDINEIYSCNIKSIIKILDSGKLINYNCIYNRTFNQ